MEYRLSITFANLGDCGELADRLLTALLQTMPLAGPVISQDTGTGELVVTVAFESAAPAREALHMTDRLDRALAYIGAPRERTMLDVHLAAVLDDDGFANAQPAALQPA